jgi:hypothetical protein
MQRFHCSVQVMIAAVIGDRLRDFIFRELEVFRRKRATKWSTGRELNPRILVLQTSALATSPPVLILMALRAVSTGEPALRVSLLALGGKIFLCQVPGFYREPGSPAVGPLARVFYRRRRRHNHRISQLPVRRD